MSMHPHDDPEDPAMTATTTFRKFSSPVLGFTCMFVLAVDEIQDFKGCPMEGHPFLWKEKALDATARLISVSPVHIQETTFY